MRSLIPLSLATLLALAGCAQAPKASPPPVVSVINSLSFTNAMTGKRDGLRSAWPMTQLPNSSELFPMAQVKQCDAAGACSWGVMRAQRSIGKVRQVDGGVALDVELELDVDRSQRVRRPDQDAAMTIPADVSALQAKRTLKKEVMLEYGKVQRFDFDFGIAFELCALRLDAAEQPVDQCDIPYI